MDKNIYLILERSSQNLQTIGESGKIILEGVFAEFGKENRNGRIYTESQYLPHLEYLKNDISKGNLLGELDHPDRYEVSLGNASHRIVELWYDAKNRQVKGKIEILEKTPKGQIAKALLDAGVPLSISSRAAGSVNEDKTVEIFQIYTYDLVAKPGFASAQLYSVNESISSKAYEYYNHINESESKFLQKNISSILGFDNNNVMIVDVSESYNTKDIEFRAEAVDINNLKNNNKVTMKENQKHTELDLNVINEKLQMMEEKINGLCEKHTNDKELSSLKEYVEQLRIIQETSLNWQSDIAKGVNKVASHVDEISKRNNKHIDLTKKISEAVNYNADIINSMQEWTSNIATTTNFLAETVDYNAEVLNNMQDWTSNQAKAINNMHEWTSSIAHNVNAVMNYSEAMFGRAMSKEDAKKILEYSEALFKKQDTSKMKKKLEEALQSTSIDSIKVMDDQKSIKVSANKESKMGTGVKFDPKTKTIIAKSTKVTIGKNKLPKGLKTLDEPTDKVGKIKNDYKPSGEGLDILDKPKTVKVPENKDKTSVGNYTKKQALATLPSEKGKKETVATNESINKSKEISDRHTLLNERLSIIADKLEKEIALNESVINEYPFTKMLSKEDRQKFNDMSTINKQKIAEEISKVPTTNANLVSQIWESALNKEVSKEPKWLLGAPANYRELYENASDEVKIKISAKADMLILESQYQINDFWEKSGLGATKTITLNEAVVVGCNNYMGNTAQLVSDDYISSIGVAMNRYK